MRRIHRILTLASLVLAVLAALALLVLPTDREESARTSSTGQTVRTTGSTTLLRSQGASVLVPITIPIVLAGVPLAFGRTRWRRMAVITSAASLLVFVILGGFSIGLFYLPAAAAMTVAAILSMRSTWLSGGPVLE